MTKNSEGKLKKQLHDLFHNSAVDDSRIHGRLDEILDETTKDLPFNIYFDNDLDGENHYSFHLKSKKSENFPSDVDEVTREVAEWLERWFFGVKKKTGLYLVNRDKTKTEKRL